MALNTYLHLKLNNTAVQGSVVVMGREGTIEVNSLEWAFDDAGNVGEIKFTASAQDKATVPIAAGLKNNAVAEALFDFWAPSQNGFETKYLTLNGTNGKVTSVHMWMLNNNDPALMRYETTIQYTMSFQQIAETWVADGTSVTLP